MSITVNSKVTSETESLPELFSWQNSWYPVTFVRDLFEDKPYSFSLYDEALIIFRDLAGNLVCLKNLCPHRAAKLSDGQIIDGKVECLYHGWQFGTDGECLHIPQLEQSAKIPQQACVKSFPVKEFQGIIWVWLGDKEIADENLIPQIAEVDTGLFVVDTVTDLPYAQDFLVENFLDPSHVFISHDRTELGMKREFAAPLEMEIVSSSVAGFVGRYKKNNSNLPWTEVQFIAPCLVKYKIGSKNSKMFGGFSLYAVPLGAGRCRVLVRRYGNFFSRTFKLKPRWLEHLRQNKILEEDLPFIVEQQRYIEQTGKNLKDIYLPLKSSDTFVIEHRKWLDKFGRDLPFYQGYTTFKRGQHSLIESNKSDRFLDELPRAPYGALKDTASHNAGSHRLSRHTKICSSCYRTYQTINLLKQIILSAAIIFAGLAIVAENQTVKIILVAISLLAVGKFAILQKLKTHFEQNYH